MARYAITGQVVLEITCYVDAPDATQAVEKAALEHPLLDSRQLVELDRFLGRDLSIYPYHMQDIAWQKAERVEWHDELVQTSFGGLDNL